MDDSRQARRLLDAGLVLQDNISSFTRLKLFRQKEIVVYEL
jgi:hypothetical protein